MTNVLAYFINSFLNYFKQMNLGILQFVQLAEWFIKLIGIMSVINHYPNYTNYKIPIFSKCEVLIKVMEENELPSSY
jgi:hypothetical protein